MRYEIKGDTLPVVICHLEAGERMITERGSMAWMSPNMKMETSTNGGFGKALAMAIVVIILQQIDANIINPKIIGSSLKTSPLLVLFSITLGGAYFGMLGMFLGVPVAVVIKAILTDYVNAKNKIRDEEEK